jgi:hypothetical protein
MKRSFGFSPGVPEELKPRSAGKGRTRSRKEGLELSE